MGLRDRAHLLRDDLRRRGAEGRALEGVHALASAGEDDALADVERRETVGQIQTVLSDEEREAIALRFGADLTVPEIAKLTGQPLTTVEGRVYRAPRKLRDEIV